MVKNYLSLKSTSSKLVIHIVYIEHKSFEGRVSGNAMFIVDCIFLSLQDLNIY